MEGNIAVTSRSTIYPPHQSLPVTTNGFLIGANFPPIMMRALKKASLHLTDQ